ncbi:hypothetical protein [Marinicellulosiphila megalodicopiae]|uniref:hypothetical protein n=1 Tax=Marinicellulosiphila megalodicopiae TaxID=2724896 RepID=UPI003BAEE711
MTDPINESFSALLDDEASSIDIQRLLKAMDSHPDKITQWKQVAAGHSSCQGEQSFDVLSQVNQALYAQGEIDTLAVHQINAKPIVEQQVPANATFFTRSKKWIGSATIAASVCAATVLGINSFEIEPTGQLQNTSVMATGNPVATPIGKEGLFIQQQLKEHFQQHSSQTSFGTTIDPSTQVEVKWKSAE